MIKLFNSLWNEVPLVVIDTETTGLRPGIDKAVQVALVRFEKGEHVSSFTSLIDPLRDIPNEATRVHGITEDDVRGAPTIEDFFSSPPAVEIMTGAQPAAYNAPFDREFVHRAAFDDWSWPWIDPLVLVKCVDRFAKGKGRHTLSSSCERHGVELSGAHSAINDARSAGELFYKIAPKFMSTESPNDISLGSMLCIQRSLEAKQWDDFMRWKAAHP